MRATPLPLVCALALSIAGHAATTTQTTLTISPSASVQRGTTVTLTAHVTANGAAVHPGTVTFCNAAAPHCEDSSILGTAQLRTDGTAHIPLRLGSDTYSIKAVFQGTPHSPTPRSPSTSAAQSLTVSGISNSLTTPPAATKIGSFYQLSTGVAAFGRLPLTGTVTFHDTVNGGSPISLGSVAIGAQPAQVVLGSPISTVLPYSLDYLVTGDFNGDGIPDVAGIEFIGDTSEVLAVLLGNGDGTFAAPLTTPIPDEFPELLAVGDFDGDGKLDLLTGEYSINFLHGNGDGTFTLVGSEMPGPGQGYPLVVADLNGDGILDLLSPGNEGNLVMLGNGDGTFNTLPFIVEYLTFFPVVGDFNGDGIPDTIAQGGNTLVTLFGNGDGTFTQGPSSPATPNVRGAAVGDFNGDGIPDLITLDDENNVAILLGKGDGTFTLKYQQTLPLISTTLILANPVVLADFNHDGKLDAAVSTISNTIELLPGNGDGTLGPAVSYGTQNPSLASLTVADYNGDGIPDIASSGATFNIFVEAVLPGTPTKALTTADINLQSDFVHSIVASYSGSTTYLPSTSTATDIITFPNITAKLHITTTGFLYSRVTRTFNGTITVTNTSSAAIAGPIQIGFNALPAGITLVNATSKVGTGFIAIPGGLAAGQTTTFSAHFSNPSNINISFATVAYSGAF
jgi:Bacterial Ig-like domain (group 3)/FG-GAP-like repeat